MIAAPRSPSFDELALLLSDRDIRILERLEQFRLLDTRLIQRLEFPVGEGGQHASSAAATRATTRVLGRLESHGCLDRVGRRVGGTERGSSQTIWQLGATGERFLRARRGDTSRRRYVTPSHAFLAHTLAVASYAARLTELARVTGFELLALGTEPDSWRRFQTASGPQILKPDLTAITADADHETHSFIEIDRSTEHLPAVLRKCHAYQAYWQSGAEQASQGLFPTVIWVTLDAARTKSIKTAIAGDHQLDSHLFHVATAEPSLAVVAPYTSLISKGGTP
ncbi:replication-relaxation family protein [Agrococcus sp. Ld7]|uniref:replication-relaxation family protein n=1 Tax=Agrococcus sp. Ld7 TaxID=649148 RepID=UPI0038672071